MSAPDATPRGCALRGLHERLASQTWPVSFLHRLALGVKRDAILFADPPRVLAGREADDLRRLRADVADALPFQRLQRFDIHAFALQQLALGGTAERVIADSAAGGHDAMAGDD